MKKPDQKGDRSEADCEQGGSLNRLERRSSEGANE